MNRGLIHQAGQTRKIAKTGAVTLIQRFRSALNLNIHFHMLFLDGVYMVNQCSPVFRRNKPPEKEALAPLMETISRRIGSYLERAGLLIRDMENSTLNLEDTEGALIACKEMVCIPRMLGFHCLKPFSFFTT